MRKTHTATISLPPQLAKRAQQVIEREGMTRSELFRQALRSYLEAPKRIVDFEDPLSSDKKRAIDKRLAQGMEDIEQGRVHGPFNSVGAMLKGLHEGKSSKK